MTRSLPLARPSRASTFGRIPFAASQAAQVPHFMAERETGSGVIFRALLKSWSFLQSTEASFLNILDISTTADFPGEDVLQREPKHFGKRKALSHQRSGTGRAKIFRMQTATRCCHRGVVDKMRVVENGASEGIRTLDTHVGNVMLYQAELRSRPKSSEKLREISRIASPFFSAIFAG